MCCRTKSNEVFTEKQRGDFKIPLRAVNQFLKIWRIASRGVIYLVLAFILSLPVFSQNQPSEWEVKAAFLFNFAKFIDWPESKLPLTAPLVIGVVGEDPFKEDLEKTIGGKNVLGHPIQTRRFTGINEARQAHILFISDSERRRVPQILKTLSGASVLTVSEMDDFCDQGGMINFKIVANKVKFEINQQIAENEGLKISSKLLNVAVVNK